MVRDPLRLWVTRTQPQADETAQRLRDIGHHPITAPVLEVRSMPGAGPDLTGVVALAFTSRNAVGAFASLTTRRDFPVYVTGEATAAEARAWGFGQVSSADGDVAALARLIVGEAPTGVVLHPGAREAAGDLSGDLMRAGVTARAIRLYETVETGVAAPPAIDGILIHSPRAGRAVAKAVQRANARHVQVYAISEAAAEPFRASKIQPVAVAQYPNEASLLKLLGG